MNFDLPEPLVEYIARLDTFINTTILPLQWLAADLGSIDAQTVAAPVQWDTLYRWGEATLGLEAQEYLVALLLEPHAWLVDDLCE